MNELTEKTMREAFKETTAEIEESPILQSMFSKGVENFGTFLTVGSILIFALENSIFKIKMDAIEAIGIWLICAIIVIGALYLLFSKYEK